MNRIGIIPAAFAVCAATFAHAQTDAPGCFIAAGLYNEAQGFVDVRAVPQAEVQRACVAAGARVEEGAVIHACTWPGADTHVLYIRDDLDGVQFWRVKLHELAHTAGWEHGVTECSRREE